MPSGNRHITETLIYAALLTLTLHLRLYREPSGATSSTHNVFVWTDGRSCLRRSSPSYLSCHCIAASRLVESTAANPSFVPRPPIPIGPE
jgi:hypothetical protein